VERVFSAPPQGLEGALEVPGDKSLSHRAVLFAALAEGVSHVRGVLDSQDVRATLSAVTALGADVDVTPQPDSSLEGTVRGWGDQGPRSPGCNVDCGNSGTTARLLLGVLAGWPITVTLTGDASLSSRPMQRVIDPLSRMGAKFESDDGTLPVTVHGAQSLSPLAYRTTVASAQVKTAILLAGLRASGGVRVTEPAPSRDHTERLLPAFGIPVNVDPVTHAASLCGPVIPRSVDVSVPGDPSSAAFLVAAALLVEGSDVLLRGVSLNPTRTGFVRVLQRMGAQITLLDLESMGAEPVGSIRTRSGARLSATTVSSAEVPSLVDEVPVLAVVASQASGTTRFEGVHELRVKESDRLAAVAEGLHALGVAVRTGDDWLEVDGPVTLRGATLDSRGDHRLAMSWALAGLIATQPITVSGFEAVDVSYPGFAQDLASLGA
jgi:3-phosphoshikimate 1-carboxyvinyltransferase